jgi:hypothetical protein
LIKSGLFLKLLANYGVIADKASMRLDQQSQARLDVLKTAPLDKWVALSADETKIIGQGDSFEEAARQADESGEKDPVLMLVPSEWIPRVL